jgi:hypothetical protein
VAYTNPSVADFKAYFNRDFPYGTDVATSVLDADIAKAFQMTNVNLNPDLWDDQSSYTIGYQLLSAHYLVMNIQTSSQGIAGSFNFLEQSKSVGSVSQGFAIPQRIMDNPYLSMLSKTSYGAADLQLLLPRMVGQSLTVAEMTKP